MINLKPVLSAFLALIISLSIAVTTVDNTIILTDSNFINLRGSINKETIDLAIKELSYLKSKNPNGPKYIVIESPGGHIVDGERFIKYAKTIKNLHTITIYAASMASAIVEALPGKRYVVPTGIFMFHRAAFLETMSGLKKFEEYNYKRIGLTLNEYRMKVISEWRIRSGKDNVNANVADRVVDIACDSSLNEKSQKYSIDVQVTREVTIKQDKKISQCPLVVQPLPL